jgi:hypothetical protein
VVQQNGGALNALLLVKSTGYLHLLWWAGSSHYPVTYAPAMPCLLLAALLPFASPPPPEQTAFNYFAAVLVARYYPTAKHLYFPGHSEPDASLAGPFAACFPGTGFDAWWGGQPASTGAPVPIATSGFPRFKRTGWWRRGGLQVRLYRAVTGPGGVYTHLYVYRAQHFVDHYVIKVSGSTPAAVEVCRASEII